MERSEGKAVAALLTVQVLFGLFPVAAKKVLPFLDPWSLLGARVAGAAFCLLAIHLVLVRNPIPIRAMFPKVAGLAFLGVILNMGLFIVGLEMTSATEAVLVITTIPVFTYGIAVALGRERMGPRRLAGILLAVAGVVVLIGFHPDPAHALGNLLVMANALSYAAFLVLARPTIQKYDALSLTTWVFLLGSVVFLPLGLANGLRGKLAALPAPEVGWLVFIILGASVLTYVLNTVMLRHVAASTVAAFTYVQPIFTAVASYLLLGETLPARILPAAALVFAGVWLVARREPKVLEGAVAAE
jgi:drug/metabolite transporter (DMT)-like permease